jgi:predicted ABC-type ATPase
MELPRLIIIAGPNGAGKTTTAMDCLPEIIGTKNFVNADLIARGLSPFDPSLVDLQATRIMVQKMAELRNAGKNFAVETTLASKSVAKFIRESKACGYETELIFIMLDSPETAVKRVAVRTAKGGHHVPETTIHRRYFRGIINLFDIYMPIVDKWTILDNSETNGRAKMVARCFVSATPIIYNTDFYHQLIARYQDAVSFGKHAGRD